MSVRLEGFDLLEFQSRVADGKVRVRGARPQSGVTANRLLAADGPRVVLDKHDRLLMYYCPQFWRAQAQVSICLARRGEGR